ncbi:MAG: lipid-A-disaccharide synthase [Bacteroidaceae bacterium]|nr:lipid-A-disaccharide synthase [Bacteroidaceae bacterium]
MKYFLIAGEASGDLHAANLMRALLKQDAQAEFRFYGGDQMQAVGGTCLCHYKNLAYMGFIPVLLHLPQILRGMRHCKAAIREWQPDAVILVDYPGFNLSIAKYVHSLSLCPVFYYIAPKIWAWKEYRIKDIRRYVDRLFSILPFEIDFFEGKHHYPISYIGNPTVDEVAAFRAVYDERREAFAERCGLDTERPIIALLAGSRRQEIKDNLLRMCRAAQPYIETGYQAVIAGAPSIPRSCYDEALALLSREGLSCPSVVEGETYPLLSHSTAALVTSGTATLETALFGVPQVVCYYVACGRFVSLLRRLFLKVPYISLVNLVCHDEVVPELVADKMTTNNARRCLGAILPGGEDREAQLAGYALMNSRLGEAGAPLNAATEMVERLRTASLH